MTTNNKQADAIYAARISEALTALNVSYGETIVHEILRLEGAPAVEQGNFIAIIYRDEDWAGSQYTLEIDFRDWKPAHFKGEMPLAAFNDICDVISQLGEAE